jgi:hypothetical protein
MSYREEVIEAAAERIERLVWRYGELIEAALFVGVFWFTAHILGAL